MRLIEPEEMGRYAEVLHAHSWDAAEFELHEVEEPDPGSDELLPIRVYVEIRCGSPVHCRDCPTGDGTAWGPASSGTCLPGGSHDSAQRASPRCRQRFGRHSGSHHG